MAVTLTRDLRFGLYPAEETSAPGSNGFAGNPALCGIAPFLVLSAAIRGEIDPQTGMLVNIKRVDRVLRDHAVPALRRNHGAGRPAEAIVSDLYQELANAFTPHRLVQLKLSPSPYLSFAVIDQEPRMVSLTLRFEFSAAHRLHAGALSAEENAEVFGRCNNPNGHGHNYEFEVTIAGEPDPASGAVITIPRLQQIVHEQIITRFDHTHLNLDCEEFKALNPTVENIAGVLFRRLRPHIPAPARLRSLRVWETPKTMCEYAE